MKCYVGQLRRSVDRQRVEEKEEEYSITFQCRNYSRKAVLASEVRKIRAVIEYLRLFPFSHIYHSSHSFFLMLNKMFFFFGILEDGRLSAFRTSGADGNFLH